MRCPLLLVAFLNLDSFLRSNGYVPPGECPQDPDNPKLVSGAVRLNGTPVPCRQFHNPEPAGWRYRRDRENGIKMIPARRRRLRPSRRVRPNRGTLSIDPGDTGARTPLDPGFVVE